MEIATFFNSKGGDRKYNATHWANYFKPLFKSGVFATATRTQNHWSLIWKSQAEI